MHLFTLIENDQPMGLVCCGLCMMIIYIGYQQICRPIPESKIVLFLPVVFALAQISGFFCKFFIAAIVEILKKAVRRNAGYLFSAKDTSAWGSVMVIRSRADRTHPFFSQDLRVRLTVYNVVPE